TSAPIHRTVRFTSSCLRLRPPPRSTLFPYTTLFRSTRADVGRARRNAGTRRAHSQPGLRPRRTGGADQILRYSRAPAGDRRECRDRKSTRLNSSHVKISYAVFCLKKKNKQTTKSDIT